MGKSKSIEPISIPILNCNGQNKPETKSINGSKKRKNLKCGTWNICKGLVTREFELLQLLEEEEIDILFITETDTLMLESESDYSIKGYKTIFPKRKTNKDKLRLLCVIKEEVVPDFEIISDYMYDGFPSIWIKKARKDNNSDVNSLAIGGFYRVWSHNGENSEASQLNRINIFTNQIEQASANFKDVIILGDANLDTNKWNNVKYLHKKVASALKESFNANNILMLEVGNTYLANHAQKNGEIARSAIDHVYCSKNMVLKVTITKSNKCSSDHLPVMAELEYPKKKKIYTRRITKRSYKQFTQERWISELKKRDWSNLENETDVNLMVDVYTKNNLEALDMCAPFKSFTIKSHYKFGLSEVTKDLMAKRENIREQMNTANKTERTILLIQYKKIRNNVNKRVRQETIEHNNNRVKEANNENEIWNIVKEVSVPKNESQWELKNPNDGITSNHQIIADTFNTFFNEKITNLQNNIDETIKEDPMEKLKSKWEAKIDKKQFNIKTTSETNIIKNIKRMHNKKTACSDGLTQELLKQGAKILAAPLTSIFNRSISSGIFPDKWKEAYVTPVLKKGDKTIKENYRPVSSLPSASKLLEMVICEQTTKFVEEEKILPPNQHGFRAKHSTMTAWSDIQNTWARSNDEKEDTGILLWDLSAAFDTLDHGLLCHKLKIYGFQPHTISWFKTFLINRTQRCKIEDCLSELIEMKSGVPQGGILSPLLFIIYVADLRLWLKWSVIITYADDTSTSVSGKSLSEIISKLEEDATMVLKFMASNGLVANASKTTFLIIGQTPIKNKELRIGTSTVKQEYGAKLLGMYLTDDFQWKEHINKTISALKSRLFLITRLKNKISQSSLKRIADSIFNSKLRYGVHLCGKVRPSESDPRQGTLDELQKVQNKLFRTLNNSRISEKISTKSIAQKLNMLTVNQINAQVKLTEIWKALNDPNYPLKPSKKSLDENKVLTRSIIRGDIVIQGKNEMCQTTFLHDASKIWNNAPQNIKKCTSIYKAKKAIKQFATTLPI